MSFDSMPSEAERAAAGEQLRQEALQREGLPEDLYKHPPKEQLEIVGKRIAEVRDLLGGLEIAEAEIKRGLAGKE